MRRIWVTMAVLALPVAANAQIVMGGGPQRMTMTSRGNIDALERSPSSAGVASWIVGQWARYNVTRVLNPQFNISQQIFRLVSVVGKSGDRYWVEVQDDVMSPSRMTRPIRKMLIPFGPVGPNSASESLVLDPQDSSIVRMTTIRAATQADTVPPFPQGWTKVGPEDVTAAGATFHTTHWKKGAEEVWVAGNAGPLGVVKFRNDDTTVELVARGETGAKSKIPESGQ